MTSPSARNTSFHELTTEDSEENQAEPPKQMSESKDRKEWLGIIFTFLSCLSLAASSLFAKLITLHPFQISASRCIGQFLITYPILVIYKRNSVDISGPKGMEKYLWLHGFLGSTAMIFLYLSIGQMSVGNAVTIQNLKAVMIGFFARIILKEALTALDVIFSMVSVVGVVLISQPSFLFPSQNGTTTSVLGVVFALISAILASFMAIVIRKIGKKSHFLLNVLYYSFVGSVSTSILLIAMDKFEYPCASELPYIFLIGACGFLGQCFLVLALQNERPAVVSVLRVFQIIMVFVLQVGFNITKHCFPIFRIKRYVSDQDFHELVPLKLVEAIL